MRLVPVLFAIAALTCLSTAVMAAEQPATATGQRAGAAFWRQATEQDVEAAYALERDNHPAALPEAGDEAFRRTLQQAHAQARLRAKAVVDFPGYSATLGAFAVALGDRHLRSRPVLVVARPAWAGLILGKHGRHWKIVDTDAAGAEATLEGAELLSCDGRSVDDWARQLLGGFRVDWNIGAQQAQAAPWLLVDEGNPFVPRPRSCVFAEHGKRREVTLQWRPIRREDLVPRLKQAIGAGAAGYGVRRAGAAAWIALQGLADGAPAVVAAVKAQAEALRNAPFVVLDLRGNGGGSSMFGRAIAKALMGDGYVDAMLGKADDSCGSTWRVTPGNVATLRMYREKLAPQHGPAFARMLDELLSRAKEAGAAGRRFTGPLACRPTQPIPAAQRPTSLMRGRMVLLTDGLCFSSCLGVVDDFRRLGAMQLGQTTDAATRYTEVRDVPMPSGLSTFSVLQAFSPADPIRLGPFVPERIYDGDIADTAAVTAWVLHVLGERDADAGAPAQ